MNNIKISTKLFVMVILTALTLVVIGIYGLTNLSTVNNSLETVYKDRVLPLKQLKVISDMYAVNIVDATHKIRNGNIDFKTGKRHINRAEEAIAANWKLYSSTFLTPDEKKLTEEAKELMRNSDESLETLKSIIEKEDKEALVAFTVNNLYPQIDPITKKLAELIDLQLSVADEEFLKGQAIYSRAKTNSYIMIILGIALSLIISMLIIKSIRQSIANASTVVSKLSEGDLTATIEVTIKMK